MCLGLGCTSLPQPLTANLGLGAEPSAGEWSFQCNQNISFYLCVGFIRHKMTMDYFYEVVGLFVMRSLLTAMKEFEKEMESLKISYDENRAARVINITSM